MSELTQSLQIAVSRYPGTMAELARRTAIDRSTLYKIINGQRTPRQEQLERLAEALELNDEQKDTLLLQYKQRGRSTDPRIRTELHKLLTTACTVQESIRHEGVAPNTAFSELPCTDRYVEGPRAVGALAGAQAGAAVGAVAGPVGAAVGSVAGGVIGGLAGTELGKEVYAYHQNVQRSLDALPYDPDDPDAYLRNLSARTEATGRGPEQRPDSFDDYGAALFGGTTSFLDTGEGLEERLATLASRDDDRRAQEELKAALLEAARNMQTTQEQPLKVELHSTLELDGAVLAQSREDIMIREAARR